VNISVVYDTMVFLQEASRPQRTHAIFQAIRDGRLTLILTAEILAEVRDVLNRDAIRRKFPALTPEAVTTFVADILAHSMFIESAPNAFSWPLHPDDDHLFNAAIAAAAKYIVTWESRLLKLGTDTTPDAHTLRQLAPQLEIVTPVQFADILRLPV
jgi:putative PIN family toxin of toxin-antitoxin system